MQPCVLRCVSGVLYLASHFPHPSLRLNDVASCAFHLPAHRWPHTWLVSTFGPLRTMPLWTVNVWVCVRVLFQTFGGEIARWQVSQCLTFGGAARLFPAEAPARIPADE